MDTIGDVAVIAVGHTQRKFLRLLGLIENCGFEVRRVFNGAPPYPRDWIVVPNDTRGRDVAMYAEGLRHTSCTSAVFLNDDVEHVDIEQLIPPARERDPGGPVLVSGVANLSNWVDHDLLRDGDRAHHERMGRALRFIRTSAFWMTDTRFWDLWERAKGGAQRFEKITLDGLHPDQFHLVEPHHAIDSNIRPYVGGGTLAP